jgi:GTPase SAR1 family protein
MDDEADIQVTDEEIA